jgi:amidohydrolase
MQVDARGESGRLEEIRQLAESIKGRVVEHFEHLHRHPELGWHEGNTAKYVEGVLEGLGFSPRRVAGTGVRVDVDANSGLPLRIVRADLDAIAAQEDTDLPYASERPGVMHGCGHDAHTAILLGVAELLTRVEKPLPRPLRLLFQPAEEVDPSGARACVQEGALEGAGDIIGLHVWPQLASGTVGLREGVVTAAADRWECELRGPGGHAARPHETVDLIRLAAAAVSAVVDVPRRHLDLVRHPTVVTVAKIHGGEVFNVIPDSLTFAGTMRTLSTEVRPMVAAQMEKLVRGICEPAGAEVHWSYHEGAPALENDSALSAQTRKLAVGLFGPEAVVAIDTASMGSEDFSHFTAHLPGLLLRLGCTPSGEQGHPLHSTRLVVDKNALPVGVSLLAALALS